MSTLVFDLVGTDFFYKCDRCPATSLYFACKDDSTTSHLALCGHHTREHEKALITGGWFFVPITGRHNNP